MKSERLSTPSQFVLWLLLFLSFGLLLNAIGGFVGSLEQGIPVWVATLWAIVPAGFILSLLALLWQRRLGLWGFLAFLLLMIPTSVAINYYALLPDQPEELTRGWFVTSTLFFTLLALGLAIMVGLAVRHQWRAYH